MILNDVGAPDNAFGRRHNRRPSSAKSTNSHIFDPQTASQTRRQLGLRRRSKSSTTTITEQHSSITDLKNQTLYRASSALPIKKLTNKYFSPFLSPSSSSPSSPSSTTLKMFSIVICFCSLLSISSGFNVETSFPVIHRGVGIGDGGSSGGSISSSSSSRSGVHSNSFFGFSISQFKSDGENYILVGAPRHHSRVSSPSPSSFSSSSSPPPSPTTGRGALFRCLANPFTDSLGAQQLCQDLRIDKDASDRVTQSQEVRLRSTDSHAIARGKIQKH